jgi:hypothetical protein
LRGLEQVRAATRLRTRGVELDPEDRRLLDSNIAEAEQAYKAAGDYETMCRALSGWREALLARLDAVKAPDAIHTRLQVVLADGEPLGEGTPIAMRPGDYWSGVPSRFHNVDLPRRAPDPAPLRRREAQGRRSQPTSSSGSSTAMGSSRGRVTVSPPSDREETMTDYVQTPEDRIDNLAKDAYVLATVAKQGRLNVKAADELVSRLRSAAADMIDQGDAEMLRTTAAGFERVSLRIKAGAAAASRAKASNGSRTGSRPAPIDYIALSHAQDLRDMASAGPFDRTDYEDVERKRAENANAVLRERRRKDEAERRRHVSPEPETPWWR